MKKSLEKRDRFNVLDENSQAEILSAKRARRGPETSRGVEQSKPKHILTIPNSQILKRNKQSNI